MLLRCRLSHSRCAAAAAFTSAASVAWHLIMKCDQGSSSARTRPSLFLCQRQRRRRVHVSAQSKAPSVVHIMSFAFACKWLCVCVCVCMSIPIPFGQSLNASEKKVAKLIEYKFAAHTYTHGHTYLHIAFSFSVLLKMCHVKRKCSTVRRMKNGNGANTAETLSHVTSFTHTQTHYCIYISLSLFCPLLTAFVHARAGQLCTLTSRHTHTQRETPCMCCGKRVPRRWLWLDNRSFSNRCWPRCRPYKVPQLCIHPTGYLSQGVGERWAYLGRNQKGCTFKRCTDVQEAMR